MNEIKANRNWIKRVNRSLVLNYVKGSGPISRRDIADLSGLSPATVSNLTGELLSVGLISEIGSGDSARGRPPVLLELNSRAGYVVGVKVMEASLVAVVTDLDAEVLHYQTSTLESTDLDGVVAAIAGVVGECLTAQGIDPHEVVGVGLGVAGVIDGETGIVRYSPFFDWRDVDLSAPLRKLLNLDVFVENDVNALTVAEQWFGHGQGVRHFAVVTVGRGIGAGFVIDGRFYGGLHGGAGEFGHLPIKPDGPICDCGNVGCLEGLASDAAVVEQYSTATGLPAAGIDLDTVIAKAEQGDKAARVVLADSGRWLGFGLATIANLLAPELIIVGGEGVRAGEWRLEPMRAAFKAHAFADLDSQAQLVIEPAGDQTWARGAACVVLGEMFAAPMDKRRVPFSAFDGRAIQ